MSTISNYNMAKAIHAGIMNKSGALLDDAISNTKKILKENGLLNKSDLILDLVQDIVDKEHDVIRAKVWSTHKLTEKNTTDIEHQLKERYKAKVVYLESIIDESIIGGIKIQVGDEVIDATFSKKISQLKKHLLN